MKTPPQTFRVGLVQMAMSREAGENLDKAVARVGEAARGRGRGGLPARALPLALLLPEGGPGPLRPRGAGPRAEHRSPRPGGQEGGRGGGGSRSSSAARAGLYHNSAVILDADGTVAGLYRKMHIPDDPLFYEKFYFTPGDLGFQAFDTDARPHRRPHLLGPVVPRGGAPHRAARRGRPLLSHRDRLASPREGAARARATLGLADHPALHAIANGVFVAVVNRVGHEMPPRAVRASSSGARRSWPTRSGWSWPRPRPTRRRSWSARWTFRAHRGGPAQLALPARPPHRRLRRDRPALPRLNVAARADPSASRPGFRMPAEWEPHEATWLGWPHQLSDWPGRFAPIPWAYGEIVRKLAPGETVRIIVPSKAHEAGARRVLEAAGADLGRVEFFRWPTDRGWTRDFGPIFVRREAPDRPVAIARFSLQRLGQVSRLEEGRTGAGARGPGPEGSAAARGLEGPAGRPRRGQHRRERPGHAPHHRGVPARPGRPGAQPGLLRARTTRG